VGSYLPTLDQRRWLSSRKAGFFAYRRIETEALRVLHQEPNYSQNSPIGVIRVWFFGVKCCKDAM
jgi:hypothetical protein